MNNFLRCPARCASPERPGTISGTQVRMITSLRMGGPRSGFEVWYVGNLSGSISIPAVGFSHGLSGWALFTAADGAVPDGGTTALLLGAALGALGMVRRFFMG